MDSGVRYCNGQTSSFKMVNISGYNFQSPIFHAPVQIGDGNTQIKGRIDHHPVDEDVHSIIQILKEKDRKITIQYQSIDIESKNYSIELRDMLLKRGYSNVMTWDHLTIGFDPPKYKVMIDTLRYVINVEWN